MNEYKISISPEALKQIKIQISKRGIFPSNLRLGVKGSGCVGFMYHLQFEDSSPKEKDLIFVFDDIQVVVDSKSILYLNGTTLDWESTLMRQGFKFNNPLQKSSCGCGGSFSF